MPRTSKRPHRAALTRMLRSTGLVHVPEEAPLVELLRSLADEMDAGGGSRVYTAYLSALKDLRRVLNVSAVRPSGTAEPTSTGERSDEAPDEDPEPKRNDLAAFKSKHGIAS